MNHTKKVNRPKRRVVYRHLDGQITTRTRPSGGLICEILFPSKRKPQDALPCIFAVEVLLRTMKGVLMQQRSPDERRNLTMAAIRSMLEAFESKDGAK